MGQYDRKAKSQPKHGKSSDSGASKAPPPLSHGRPGWTGPGYLHKKKKPQRPSAASESAEPRRLNHILPVGLEQLMINVFRTTFPACNDFEALKPRLQKINRALLSGEFDIAFGKAEYLEAYAIRWSPSRALAYAQLMAWICEEMADDAYVQRFIGCDSDREQKAAKVVCFGGGAAEIMAFSGLLRHVQPSAAAGRPELSPNYEGTSKDLQALPVPERETSPTLLNIDLIDTVDWSVVLSKLHECLETPPTLSKYASAAARASNASFLSLGTVRHTFTRANVLSYSTEDLRAAIGPVPALLTLLFTLNELYAASISQTTSFLLRVTEAAPKGSLLLVVDSLGAYSEPAVCNSKEGEEKKKYPMSHLMNYALMPKPKKEAVDVDSEGGEDKSTPAWEKVISEDSVLYGLQRDLEYPVSLENMRFQAHLFKRV
ncbi:hypothetical protein CTAM01_08137 [Colletotrichum tamarilloi]|uniref:25S rRNA (Uridine(2843)-N(3))-methyltransferase n=1 Tax=Colletotrichum tamarilloi TaxID=1209934 RepID=A0ABQ9R7B6_9PEZI|nr:uncharacterized protein CTAM01_08137 [Colletotrichum tamarilloi]KAK1497125.1 hypothetical protein CTAM01_08137 [Colletotrichum tamarilloi]